LEPEPLLVVGSSPEMLAMMQAVGSPQLKVNLDVGHAQITDDDVATTIRELGSSIVHLHLEDIKGRVHKHLPFGEGDMDFGAVRRALDDIGYVGPYVVDLFGLEAAPSEVAADALASLRRLFG
jgi:sugar phosphate isomerase/epimerase